MGAPLARLGGQAAVLMTLLGGGSVVLADLTGRALRDGWLHTGDLGRLGGEGCLYLDGRLDAESLDVEPVGS